MSDEQSNKPNEQTSFINSPGFSGLRKVLAVFSAIAVITGFVISHFIKERELQINISDAVDVTKTESIPGLTNLYTYQGDTIFSFWQAQIEISNTGTETIIGKGSESHLLDSVLTIPFDKELKIVGLDVLGVPAVSFKVANSQNAIFISFDQWKAKEKVQAIGYFIPKTPVAYFPVPIIESRPIIDCPIVSRILNTETTPSNVFIDRLSKPIPLIARIMTLTLCAAFFIVLLLLWSSDVWDKDSFRYWDWKKRMRPAFAKFIKEAPWGLLKDSYRYRGIDQEDTEENRNKMIDTPYHINNVSLRSQFDISDEYPHHDTPTEFLFAVLLWISGLIAIVSCALCTWNF